MKNTLIVFARTPELGKVKTRLAKDIGNLKALAIYTALLNKTLDTGAKVKATLAVYWTVKHDNQNGFLQVGNDLGERMHYAISTEITKFDKVCLIGTDTPQISSTIIEQVFSALNTVDIIFGPSLDGGYYLVAIKTAPPLELFIGKQWSHQKVLEDALNICNTLDLKVKLLPPLLDIDTVSDYNKWQQTK